MKIEDVIFSNLLYNEEYSRKTIPFLKAEYFHDAVENKIYTTIHDYILKYNSVPTKEALLIDLSNVKGLSESQFTIAKEKITGLTEPSTADFAWVLDKTEEFCKDKAIYNGIMQSIKILDDSTGNLSRGAIPQIMSDALAVSFDTSIGHDYIDDADSRYDFYHNSEENRIAFDIDKLNDITNGGLPRKTLNMLLASTGVGKSMAMCHMAAANIMNGYNVLYITLEMSQEKIAERIDANLLDVEINSIKDLDKSEFDLKVERVKSKSPGKLVIKEYPTSSASAANFRHLLNELKLKKNFVPDVIYIDYLNICASARVKNSNANSYTINKSIAEELRGLAVEFNVVLISATQTTRNGANNSEIEITDTSESFGVPASCDLLIALISTPELEELFQIMIKQLKNRYNDINKNNKFVVGIDRGRMRMYNVENTAHHGLISSPQSYAPKPNVSKFKDFK